jgi:hypothetical protein
MVRGGVLKSDFTFNSLFSSHSYLLLNEKYSDPNETHTIRTSTSLRVRTTKPHPNQTHIHRETREKLAHDMRRFFPHFWFFRIPLPPNQDETPHGG